MWYRFLIGITCCFVFTNSLAQQENVWVFGDSSGLDFNNGNPIAIKTAIQTREACASVCDATARLLFYTEGSRVWDRNNNLMPNGFNLLPFLGNPTVSTSQGTLIVPMPDSNNKYYVFSLTSLELGVNSGRLYYSVVDISMNNGLGDIVPGKKGILLDTNLLEKMTAVVGNSCNVWLLVCSATPKFKAYEINVAGISRNPIISNVGLGGSAFGAQIGIIAVSPDRRKVVSTKNAPLGDGAFLYDFNAATGLISNPVNL